MAGIVTRCMNCSVSDSVTYHFWGGRWCNAKVIEQDPVRWGDWGSPHHCCCSWLMLQHIRRRWWTYSWKLEKWEQYQNLQLKILHCRDKVDGWVCDSKRCTVVGKKMHQNQWHYPQERAMCKGNSPWTDDGKACQPCISRYISGTYRADSWSKEVEERIKALSLMQTQKTEIPTFKHSNIMQHKLKEPSCCRIQTVTKSWMEDHILAKVLRFVGPLKTQVMKEESLLVGQHFSPWHGPRDGLHPHRERVYHSQNHHECVQSWLSTHRLHDLQLSLQHQQIFYALSHCHWHHPHMQNAPAQTCPSGGRKSSSYHGLLNLRTSNDNHDFSNRQLSWFIAWNLSKLSTIQRGDPTKLYKMKLCKLSHAIYS